MNDNELKRIHSAGWRAGRRTGFVVRVLFNLLLAGLALYGALHFAGWVE